LISVIFIIAGYRLTHNGKGKIQSFDSSVMLIPSSLTAQKQCMLRDLKTMPGASVSFIEIPGLSI
jgi:hypothetical protein